MNSHTGKNKETSTAEVCECSYCFQVSTSLLLDEVESQ